MRFANLSLYLLGLMSICLSANGQDVRIRDGLQVLFDFESAANDRFSDTSQMDTPIALRIETPKSATISNGVLEIKGSSMIRSLKRADKIHRACTWTNELTIETWIQPADDKQKGPARIVSFSRDGSQRNFTLGQDGNRYDVRLRTNRTTVNGLPSLATPANAVKSSKPTHVIYTRARDGQAKIFLDGKVVASGEVPGDFLNWSIDFRLVLGNEQSNDRAWKGKVFLVAIYNRALGNSEILQNFRAGINGKTPAVTKDDQQDLFKKSIAPIFALHCLECHDTVNREGGLDLSRKLTAFEGDSGKVIMASNSDDSLLWESIESDVMPHNRPALKTAEKKLVKKWIDSGASWSVDEIDPAIFLRSRIVDASLLRRLTIAEYVASVKTAVGVDIENEAKKRLPNDLRADGFSNTAYNLNVDLKHIEIYASLARKIVEQINLEELLNKVGLPTKRIQKGNAKAMDRMLNVLGKWILRGPLNETELTAFRNVTDSVFQSGGDSKSAIRRAVQAMLQSPRFLYQIEQQRGDGTDWPTDAFTKANRASFMIWGSPPDRELFQLADSGELRSKKVYQAQISRMLKDPKAKARSREFVTQWLHLDRLESLRPNTKKFPNWKPELAAQMKEETIRFWDEIVWQQNRPLKDLFDAELTFMTRQLAIHYGVQESITSGFSDGWNQVALKNLPGRRGILTHGSVLTVGGDEASMVSRGLFVLDDILRGVVKDPPACVDTTPQPTKAGLTQRSIAIQRIENRNCGGCHVRFEPLAFGFEQFNGLGTYKTKDEHGNPLRQDGEIQFPGATEVSRFKSSKELAGLIAASQRTTETMCWKMTQFALGRPLGPSDIDAIKEIHLRSVKNGGTYSAVMNAIATSNLVLKIKTEPYPKEP